MQTLGLTKRCVSNCFVFCALWGVLSTLPILFPISFNNAWADYGDSASKFFAGFGLYIPFSGRLATSDSGSSVIAPLLPELSLLGEFNTGWGFGISPMISYTVLGHQSVDGGEKSRYLPISVRIDENFDPFDLRVGPGILFYSINGSGGTSVQSNGGSTTTFAFPSSSVTARLFFIDFGVGFNWGVLRFDLDGLASGIFSDKRALSLTTNLSYGFF